MSLEPLENLPIEIRRALSMATMGEQVIRLIEKSENMRNRGANGGNQAAANRRSPEAIAAAQMRREQEEKKMAADEAARDAQKANSVRPWDYETSIKNAAHGDKRALEVLRIDQDTAINICKRKGIPL